jgi:hypothetical protein
MTQHALPLPAASRPRLPVALLVTVAVSLAYLLATLALRELAPLLPLGLMNIWAVWALRKRLSPLVSSPAFYFAIFMSVIGVFGAPLVNRLAGAGGTSGANFVLTDDVVALTGNLFLAASLCVLVGAWFGRGERRGRDADLTTLLDFGDLTKHSGLILSVGAIEVALLIGASGVGPLLNRPTYLFMTSSSTFETALQMLTLGVLVAVGLVAFGSHGTMRWAAIILIALIAAFFVSLGTRRLALVPLLLLFAAVLVRRGRIPVLGSIVAIAASILSLTLPLTFRGQPTHGLVPHLRSLAALQLGPEQVVTNLNNIFVGFRITALTAFRQPPIPIHTFAVSVSPLPGDMLGWPVLSRTLRLNAYTPYSTIGEIGNHGFFFAVVFFLALGVALGLIQRGIAHLLHRGWTRIFGVVILGVLVLFVVQSIEYNLRSTIRYVYLAAGLTAVLVAVTAFRARRREAALAAAPRPPASVRPRATRAVATRWVERDIATTSPVPVGRARTEAAQALGPDDGDEAAEAIFTWRGPLAAPEPLWGPGGSSTALPRFDLAAGQVDDRDLPPFER